MNKNKLKKALYINLFFMGCFGAISAINNMLVELDWITLIAGVMCLISLLSFSIIAPTLIIKYRSK